MSLGEHIQFASSHFSDTKSSGLDLSLVKLLFSSTELGVGIWAYSGKKIRDPLVLIQSSSSFSRINSLQFVVCHQIPEPRMASLTIFLGGGGEGKSATFIIPPCPETLFLVINFYYIFTKILVCERLDIKKGERNLIFHHR